MKETLETPDQMLERLERMGLDHVKNLLESNHFDPKTLGLVHGWVARKAEEQNPTPAAPKPEAVAQEALQTARQAIREARNLRVAAAKTQRLFTIAIAVAGAGFLVSVLTLFAISIR